MGPAFALALSLLIGVPVAYLAATSFQAAGGGWTLGNYVELLSDPSMVRPFVLTMWISAAVAVACLLVAAPLGWLCARTDLPFRRLIRGLVIASFVTPPFVGAIAWEILAAPNAGLLNQWYRSLFHLERSVHLFNIYSIGGLIFVNFLYTFPIVFVLIHTALERIPADMEEASANLGARTLTTLTRITFPLIVPALTAGAIVSFLQSMTVFGSAAIITLPAGFHTMTTRIWSLFQFPPKPGLAAAAALPMIGISAGLLWTQQRFMGRRSYAVLEGKGGRRRQTRLGWWRWPALSLGAMVLACSIFFPYAALVKAAIARVVTEPLGPDNLTLKHVTFVFGGLSETRQALEHTFVLGLGAATIGLVVATIVGYFSVRRAVWGAGALRFIATTPLAIPSIVLGVGLFLAYTRPPVILYGTLWILLLAYVTIELPGAFLQIEAGLRTVDPDLENAGRTLGVRRMRVLWDVTLPLLRGGIVACWCFVFIGAIREISASIMLFTAQTNVVSVLIYDLNESGDIGDIAVLSIALLLVSFAVVGLAIRLGAKERGSAEMISGSSTSLSRA
ncbi:MAG: iron ABC transporter permease [Candidatus Eremiobacteraeota bacterium]|nr:iron ABC transporter permease [Candidatus Eremiobacteraeota bacterium]